MRSRTKFFVGGLGLIVVVIVTGLVFLKFKPKTNVNYISLLLSENSAELLVNPEDSIYESVDPKFATFLKSNHRRARRKTAYNFKYRIVPDQPTTYCPPSVCPCTKWEGSDEYYFAQETNRSALFYSGQPLSYELSVSLPGREVPLKDTIILINNIDFKVYKLDISDFDNLNSGALKIKINNGGGARDKSYFFRLKDTTSDSTRNNIHGNLYVYPRSIRWISK